MIKRFERRTANLWTFPPPGAAPYSPLRSLPFWRWPRRPRPGRAVLAWFPSPGVTAAAVVVWPPPCIKPTPRRRPRRGLVVMPRLMPGNSAVSPQMGAIVMPRRPRPCRGLVWQPHPVGPPQLTPPERLLIAQRMPLPTPRPRRGIVVKPYPLGLFVGFPFVSVPTVRVSRPRPRRGLVARAVPPGQTPLPPLVARAVMPRRVRPRPGRVTQPRWLYSGDTNRSEPPPRTVILPPRKPPRRGLVYSSRLVPFTPAPARPTLFTPPRPKPRRGRAILGSLLSLQPAGLPMPPKIVMPSRKRPGRAVVLLARWWPPTAGVPHRPRVSLPQRRKPRPGIVRPARVPATGTILPTIETYPDPDASTSDEG